MKICKDDSVFLIHVLVLENNNCTGGSYIKGNFTIYTHHVISLTKSRDNKHNSTTIIN